MAYKQNLPLELLYSQTRVNWRRSSCCCRKTVCVCLKFHTEKSKCGPVSILLLESSVNVHILFVNTCVHIIEIIITNPTYLRVISGVFETPKPSKKLVSSETLSINIICDNIREPGNLGSILRMADGVGCRNVLLTTGKII